MTNNKDERKMIGRVAFVLVVLWGMQGCGIGFGMTAVSYGGLQVNLVAEDVRKRAEASNAMEPDLIQTSIEAVSKGKVKEAEQAFLHIYEDTSYPINMRAQALYQIGLMYSVPTHDAFDKEKALSYFEKLMEEFPSADTNLHVSQRIAELQDPDKEKKRYIPNKMLRQ